MHRSLFISFEGSEGCGKTTQIERLCARFTQRGREVIRTREPGGTRLGEALRTMLKFSPEGRGMCPPAELFLFAASRAQLVHEVINPAVLRGAVVVSDRFLDSTTVYQGVARQIDSEMVEVLNAFAVGGTLPDITILLDLEPAAAAERLSRRANSEGSRDRMEDEPHEFYSRVREGYIALAKKSGNRFKVIDASGSANEIEEAIWKHITRCRPDMVQVS